MDLVSRYRSSRRRKILVSAFAAVVVGGYISYLIASRPSVKTELDRTLHDMQQHEHEISEKFIRSEAAAQEISGSQTVDSTPDEDSSASQ